MPQAAGPAHNINVGQAKHARIIQQEVAKIQTGAEPAELAGGIGPRSVASNSQNSAAASWMRHAFERWRTVESIIINEVLAAYMYTLSTYVRSDVDT